MDEGEYTFKGYVDCRHDCLQNPARNQSHFWDRGGPAFVNIGIESRPAVATLNVPGWHGLKSGPRQLCRSVSDPGRWVRLPSKGEEDSVWTPYRCRLKHFTQDSFGFMNMSVPGCKTKTEPDDAHIYKALWLSPRGRSFGRRTSLIPFRRA